MAAHNALVEYGDCAGEEWSVVTEDDGSEVNPRGESKPLVVRGGAGCSLTWQ